jgi:hypothetical protein
LAFGQAQVGASFTARRRSWGRKHAILLLASPRIALRSVLLTSQIELAAMSPQFGSRWL